MSVCCDMYLKGGWFLNTIKSYLIIIAKTCPSSNAQAILL